MLMNNLNFFAELLSNSLESYKEPNITVINVLVTLCKRKKS